MSVSDSSIYFERSREHDQSLALKHKAQKGVVSLTCSKHIGTDGRPHSSFVHDACAPQEQFHISHSDVDFTCKGRKCCMTEDILQTDASCQHRTYDQAYHLSGEIVVVCS